MIDPDGPIALLRIDLLAAIAEEGIDYRHVDEDAFVAAWALLAKDRAVIATLLAPINWDHPEEEGARTRVVCRRQLFDPEHSTSPEALEVGKALRKVKPAPGGPRLGGPPRPEIVDAN